MNTIGSVSRNTDAITNLRRQDWRETVVSLVISLLCFKFHELIFSAVYMSYSRTYDVQHDFEHTNYAQKQRALHILLVGDEAYSCTARTDSVTLQVKEIDSRTKQIIHVQFIKIVHKRKYFYADGRLTGNSTGCEQKSNISRIHCQNRPISRLIQKQSSTRYAFQTTSGWTELHSAIKI